MDPHHHHHHHHQHGSNMVTTTMMPVHVVTQSSTSTSGLLHHQHQQHLQQHQHHQHHTMTFQLWTTSKFLLESWAIDNTGGLTAALLLCMFLAVVYEGSKFYYHIGKIIRTGKPCARWRGTTVAHYVSRLWKSVAYMVHFVIGYILMLCTMTYNIWVLIAVCLGAGIGHFFLFPLIMHVVQRNADLVVRAARKPCEPLLSQIEASEEAKDSSQEEAAPLTTDAHDVYVNGDEQPGTYAEVDKLDESSGDIHGSVSDDLLRQISNVRHSDKERKRVQDKHRKRENVECETFI